MIQKMTPPPSLTKEPEKVVSSPSAVRAEPRVIPQTETRKTVEPVVQRVATPPVTEKKAFALPFNPIAKYEQTQKFLKDQILSVQKKSKNLKETERSMVVQSIFALSGSLALVLIFIFFYFPLLIRFAGNLSSLSVFPQTDTIPPRVPAVSAPIEATRDDFVELKGFGEPKSTLIVVKNNNEAETVVISDTGEFDLKVALDEGENKLALYSVDEAKNESSLGKQFVVSFDRTAPEVDWQTPEENKVVKNLREKTIEIKGKINESVKLSLNDQFVSTSNDGTFTTQHLLNEGENKLILKAVDKAGNETVIERIVQFKP